MTRLLVDIGNTRLKWGLAQNGEISGGCPLGHDQTGQQELVDHWRKIPIPDRLAISCVGSKEPLERVCSAAVALWPKVSIILARSEAYAFGVSNAYPVPEKLGVDRWMALIAARRHYPGPACIIDCGTAITIDLIDAEGRHEGGLISPGLALMKKSLADGTDALSFTAENYPVGPANFTEAAIYSGTLCAAAGLIEHTVRRQQDNRTLILTGGDAALIAGHLACRAILDTELVLRGLAIITTEQR